MNNIEYMIPRSTKPQPSIEFEVMHRQMDKTELFNILRESAINAPKVPLQVEKLILGNT